MCTFPLSILSQIPINVSAPMKAAIDAVPYASAVKFGLQFSRRFWEEDEHIFGGICYTDLPIRQISYPSAGFNTGGKGVLLGGYTFDGAELIRVRGDVPRRAGPARGRLRRADPSAISEEFENGVAVAWSRVPFTLGCAGDWSDEARKAHYDDLCRIDGRIVLAGEHASYIPAWQEGAILSALDAITAPAQAGSRFMRRVARFAPLRSPFRPPSARQRGRDASAKNAGMSHGWEFSRAGRGEPVQPYLRRLPSAGRERRGRRRRLSAARRRQEPRLGRFVLEFGAWRSKGMPPVGSMMSDAQVADVVTYVRTHFGNAYPGAVSAAEVAAARRRAGP